jgi:hypothetical protein
MSGIRVVRTKGTRYSIDVTCPKCEGELAQENANKEDKFYRVFALYCGNCRATFSLGIVLRTEQTSHPIGARLGEGRYGKNEDAVSAVPTRRRRAGVYHSGPSLPEGAAKSYDRIRQGRVA